MSTCGRLTTPCGMRATLTPYLVLTAGHPAPIHCEYDIRNASEC